MDPGALDQAEKFVATEGKELHSLLIVRNGHLVSETYWPPYERTQKHILNSCTKTVVSALVGIATDDGLLRKDDKVLGYFPELAPANRDDAKEAITIKHLLTMSSGISWPQYGPDNVSDKMGKSPDWVKFILDRPIAAAPGTVTNYSNGDSHLLSAIIGKVTRSTALDFGRERLFDPLGVSDIRWDSDLQGRSIGSAALYMKPIDMTKLGRLYLASGVWNGQRILSADWVKKFLYRSNADADQGWRGRLWLLLVAVPRAQALRGVGRSRTAHRRLPRARLGSRDDRSHRRRLPTIAVRGENIRLRAAGDQLRNAHACQDGNLKSGP